MRKFILVLLVMLSVCAVAAQVQAAQPEDTTIELKYDDRKDLAQLLDTTVETVEITEQNPTSCQVGTDTKDTAVLYYEDGILYAVGTGTAALTVNGTAYSVTVVPAEISLFMYTGHSVGHGAQGSAAQSVVVEAGQAYSSYNPKSLDLTQVEGYGLGWGASKRVGNEDVSMPGGGNGHIDAFAAGNNGTRGSGSALAYRWNQLTGQKVWVINVAVGGSCLNEWMPDAEGHSTTYSDYYNTAVAMYTYAQTILTNEIAAGHYALGHMGIIYYCGANQANYPDWSYESIRDNYNTLWNGFKTAFTRDMNGDGSMETVEFLGLVPYWTESNRNSLGFDKSAAFYMGGCAEYGDIFMASNEYRKYMTLEGLASFPAISYTTQSVTPTVPTAVSYAEGVSSVMASDSAHPTQVVYNAIGMDTANNIYAWFTGADQTITSFELNSIQFASIPDSATVRVGEGYLVVPVFEPVYAHELSYEVTGNAKIVYPLQVVGTAPGTATLTVKQGDNVLRTVEFTVTEGHDTHCVCGGTEVQNHTCSGENIWVPLGNEYKRTYYYEKSATETRISQTVLLGGNYYLTGDMTWSGSICVAPDQTVNICLNGHKLTTTDRSFRINGTVNICDCEGGGQVYSQRAGSAPVAYLYSGAEMNIYGGTYTSAAPSNRKFAGCMGVSNETFLVGYTAERLPSTLNVYGGHLIGSDLDSTDGTLTGGGRGGVITVVNGNCVLNVYGGTLTGGNTVNGNCGGGVIAAVGHTNLQGGTFSGSTDAYGAVWYTGSLTLGGQVTFSNNEHADIYVAGRAMTVEKLTKTQGIRLDAADPSVMVAQLSNASDAESFVSTNTEYTQLRTRNNGLYFTTESVASAYAGAAKLGDYETFAEAVIAAQTQNGYVKLIWDVHEEVTVSGELWVDLNGFDLSGITVAGTLCGMDSATNSYTDDSYGVLACVLSDQGKVVSNCKTDATRCGAVRRYLAISVEEGYSFHRIYMGITHMSVAPASVAVGYKAVFAGSNTVKANLDTTEGFGYKLWVGDYNPVTRSYGNERFQSMQPVSLRVQNLMSSKYTEEVNAANSDTEIYGCVYVKLLSGEVVTSVTYSCNFHQIMELADDNVGNFSDAQINGLCNLEETYESVMKDWDIPNIHHMTDGWEQLTDYQLADGKYYLCNDTVLTETVTVPEGVTAQLCLNGHTLTGAENLSRMFDIAGTLTITDHDGNIVTTYTDTAETAVRGNVFLVQSGGVLNLYCGTLSSTGKTYAGNIGQVEGTFNQYGGTITGGQAAYRGANLAIVSGGVWNFEGGTVSNGSAAAGGNVWSNGNTTINGGTVTGGYASGSGGNFYVGGGTFKMLDGTVSNGEAVTRSGNLHLAGGKSTISGGLISGGTAGTAGGNITIWNSNVPAVLGGTITGGDSPLGGGIYAANPMIVGGTAVISGNENSDIYIAKGKMLTLQNLEKGAAIGITMNVPGVFATGTAADIQWFFSNDTKYSVVCEDGSLKLA